MKKEGIISSQINEDEGVVDKALRPTTLKEFVGQAHIKDNLSIFINAAKSRDEALDHVILYGPPGLGKTTIAQIIANELNVNIKITSGAIIAKAGDLAAILTNLEKGDVLFIDEIHRLNTHVEEILYPAMEDFTLDILIGEGASAKSVQIDLPPFTLIGATTRIGLLSNPLRDRFGIPLKLNFYNHDELKLIIERSAKLLKLNLKEDGAMMIAKRSRGTPRIALRLLRRIRDFAHHYDAKGVIDSTLASNALDKLEVDNIGLDSHDRKYLQILINQFDGGPVGIESMAAAMFEQRDSIEETIEPFLIQQGFVNRTSRGRMATQLSYQHLGIKFPETVEKAQVELFDNE
ncbi:MAG: Holliday junction branch migration DNA helicase RuvB [Sphingobacteriia bacterium]|nr:Holliday junction branch migration DNA helicase RuvB [Sphingobacteriia bacterium]